jgi:hypothetical protein
VLLPKSIVEVQSFCDHPPKNELIDEYVVDVCETVLQNVESGRKKISEYLNKTVEKMKKEDAAKMTRGYEMHEVHEKVKNFMRSAGTSNPDFDRLQEASESGRRGMDMVIGSLYLIDDISKRLDSFKKEIEKIPMDSERKLCQKQKGILAKKRGDFSSGKEISELGSIEEISTREMFVQDECEKIESARDKLTKFFKSRVEALVA